MSHKLQLLCVVLLFAGIPAWCSAQETGCTVPISVDDFESYTGDVDAGQAIWQTWVDGYEDSTNGSTVGHGDLAETGIVIPGSTLSMPVAYDNSIAPHQSWVERAWSGDLAENDMKVLRLWFRGQAASVGSLSVAGGTHTLTGGGTGIGGFHDGFHYATQELTGNSTITAQVQSVSQTDAWARAGVMIRESLDHNVPHASVLVAASGRVAFVFRNRVDGNSHSTHTDVGVANGPHWVRLTRTGMTFAAFHSADGSNWEPVASNDAQDPSSFDIPMDQNVYVGLAVTANNVAATCEAALANITLTGSATAGDFSVSQDVGINANSPEELYVRVVDAAGQQGVSVHPAGTAAAIQSDWTQWAIPVQEFADQNVDVHQIEALQIGVGHAAQPTAGGAGQVWVDDIALIRRLPLAGMVLLFAEDFEGLPLGPNQDEDTPGDAVWTSTAPTGWTLDDTGVSNAGDPDNGVDEWEGWSFADNDWWASVDDQDRSKFTLACGTAAIADSDEYDDKGDTGDYATFMSSPVIDVLGVEAGNATLTLRFDSSWRPESAQKATISATFDDGAPVEILRWESDGASAYYHDHMTNELVTVNFGRPAGAKNLILTFGYFDASNNWWWAVDNLEVQGVPRIAYLLQEDWDDVPLGPNVEEGNPGEWDAAWTDTPPTGWEIDESGVPGVGDPATDGVTEWAGWAIANKDFWVIESGDQRRVEYTKASGNILVADGDEWDDAPHPEPIADDPYDTWITTPVLDVSEMNPYTLKLKFDSSWRPEYDDSYHQTANITISYDGGDPVEILRWESDSSSPNFKNDESTNDTIVLDLQNPPKASTVQLTFGYFDAGNDWWWAIDNLEISGLPVEKIPVFTEDFEGLPLEASVEEDDAPASDAAWTHVAPEGWAIDNSGVPAGGTVEWEGWSFTDVGWWSQIGQNREMFTLGTGIVAVADGDEWDDFLEETALMSTLLTTPAIDIAGLGADTVELVFASSWRDEDSQTAVITASFDGAAPVEVLRWESDSASAFFHDDAENETVIVPLHNPLGAQSVVLTFACLDAGNDWWWAIDNIAVQGFPKQNTVRLFAENFESVSLSFSPEETPASPEVEDVWSDDLPEGWVADDSQIPVDDVDDGVTEWLGWNVAYKDWWVYVAGDQRRSEFELGEGAVLIADSDEWDDAAHPAGVYNAFVSTPAISLAGSGSSLSLQFASSWRPEVTQTGTITASFDGAAPVEILRWESVQGANYHDHMVSELVEVDFTKPAGAQNVVLTLAKTDASNNWWWAVDNIDLSSDGQSLFFEDFESLTLGPPVDEVEFPPAAAIREIWSNVPPSDWINDNSAMPGIGDPATDGVTDWAGWAFANKDWWVEAAEDQERSQFLLGEGTVAVADPDEWDDADHPEGLMNAFLITPIIAIPAEILPEKMQLKFSSSWRREDTQTALITVSFDGADAVEVLRWESEGADTGFLKDDATNEAVVVDLFNPAGAQTLEITFGMLEAGNDWWWAIDNIEILGEVAE